MISFSLEPLSKDGIARAQAIVTARHYLRKPIDPRCSVEGYEVHVSSHPFGVLLLGRPQATRCYPWYGSVQDVETGRSSCTRWQVLNLARVFPAGLYRPEGGVPLDSGIAEESHRNHRSISYRALRAQRSLFAQAGA